MLIHVTLGQTGRPTASPECQSHIVHHPRAPEQRSSPSHPDMTPAVSSLALIRAMDVSNRPEMSKPGQPVQRLVVEPLYRCRRSVALSVLLRCSGQRCTCVWNLQACGECWRLSRGGHATSTIISHRLVWCRRGGPVSWCGFDMAGWYGVDVGGWYGVDVAGRGIARHVGSVRGCLEVDMPHPP